MSTKTLVAGAAAILSVLALVLLVLLICAGARCWRSRSPASKSCAAPAAGAAAASRRIVLVQISLSYFVFMLLRTAVSFSLSAMQHDPALNLTNDEVGNIVSAGTSGIIIGKVLIGPMVDVMGGGASLCTGLALVASALVGSTYATDAAGLVIGRALLLFFWAISWPAGIKWGATFGLPGITAAMAMASRVGGTLGNAVTGSALTYLHGSWRDLFLWLGALSSVVLVGIGATWQVRVPSLHLPRAVPAC